MSSDIDVDRHSVAIVAGKEVTRSKSERRQKLKKVKKKKEKIIVTKKKVTM
jgi:hypothetical protein